MPETLDTLGAKIDGLARRFDQSDKRFDGIDGRLDGIDGRLDGHDSRFGKLDKRLDEMESRLGVKIDAVESLARLAVERLDDVLKKDVAISLAHARLDTRIDAHDIRILALERRERPKA